MYAVIAALTFAFAVYLAVAISPAETLRREALTRLRPPPGLRQRLHERLGAMASGRFLSRTVRAQMEATGLSTARYLQRGLVYGLFGVMLLGFDAGTAVAPLGIVLGLAFSRLLLWRRYCGWLAEVVGNTADLVTFLKVRLQAGDTVEQAVHAVTSQLRGALLVEWKRMLAERESGADLREALLHLGDRVYDRDFGAVMGQLAVYDRESVPEEPFQNLAGHLARIGQLRREYLVRRSTSSISVLTGIAVFSAVLTVVAPTLYLLWMQTVGQLKF